MSVVDPIYDDYSFKRYKAMVEMPLLTDVYDKLLKVETELYQLKMMLSKYIESQTDDGR